MQSNPLFKKSGNIRKLLPLFLVAGAAAGFLLFPALQDENRKFEKLATRIFESEMLGNTLDMHYTLAYPENYGITDYTVIFPRYSKENKENSIRTLSDYLDALNSLDTAKLSKDNQYTCRLLFRSLQHSLKGCSFSYFDDPLSPSSGMQSQLPILLAEYTFRREQDVTDYLALLDQTDEYFASLALYEKEKAAAGISPADASLEEVIKQCDTILTLDDLESNTHFLQTTFAERLKKLIDTDVISVERAEYYLSLNDRLLSTVMQPAYQQLADDLTLLLGTGSSPTGLSSYPGGQEYYAYLVEGTTGSSRSIEEIKKILLPTFRQERQKVQELLQTYPGAITAWTQMRSDTAFPYDNAGEILTDLTAKMQQDFPLLSTSAPAVTVKTVSKNLAPFCAPAFYLTPPLDDTASNVIYINPLSTTSGLELYTTLAHEGCPGHLYQSVYSNTVMQQNHTHPVRRILSYPGYQEGWALYVEFLSYDYAASLAAKRGKEDLACAYEIEKHNRCMQLCLYSLLDISIHYDNASYEQIHQVLSAFGVKDSASSKAVYDYIAEEPANYLKYFLGYLEILSLKEKAGELWQNDYSDYRFHQFFLDCGPSDFDTLEMTLS